MRVKVFIVQRTNGEILAAKLARDPAQAIAKANAPCRVRVLWADKLPPDTGHAPKERIDGTRGDEPERRASVRLEG